MLTSSAGGNASESTTDGSLIDYKVHVFNNGEPAILVCCDHAEGKLVKKVYYNCNWNWIDLREGESETFDCLRPDYLECMLSASTQQAARFPFVRVDWYECENTLWFGEMAFTPTSGARHFLPPEWNCEFRRRIDLNAPSSEEG